MKKFLSLVLALIMTMSLVTVSAGAKDFTDDDSLTYDEAVAVMSEIGVIDGYTDGTFKPQNGLTRGAAAKIICNMILGPTTAAALRADTAPFKDVAVDNQYAGYIAYCVQQGITAGYTDGTYRPAAPLTSFAFMKMLLGALGYDQEIEGYVGANCFINVAKQAIGIGLDAGLTEEFNGGKQITREEAALFAFNTLKADLVEYETKITSTINGATVTIGNSAAKAMTWKNSATRRNNIKNDQYVQFAEQYFTKLQLENGTDAFGRPARTWTLKNEEIGTYVKNELLVETYSTKVTGKDLYTLLGSSALKNCETFVYIDGVGDPEDQNVNATFSEGNIVKTNTKGVGGTGNGVTTEVYVDEDVITIVIVNTFLAKVDGDYDAKKEILPVKVYSYDDTTGKNWKDTAKTASMDIDGETVDVEGFEDGDFVLVQIADGEVKVIEAAEALKDSTLTAFSLTKNTLTTDGTVYDKANTAQYSDAVLKDYTGLENLKDKTYNVYLDQYGYFIGVELVEEDLQYVFVTGYEPYTKNLAAAKADAAGIFLDGTMDTITVKVTSDLTTEGWDSDGDPVLNTWYSYTVNNSGVYTLTPVVKATTSNPTSKTVKAAQFAWSYTDADKTIDKAHVSLPAFAKTAVTEGTNTNVGGVVYGNAKTVYINVGTQTLNNTSVALGTAKIIDEVESVSTGVKNTKMDVLKVTSLDRTTASGGVYTLYNKDGYIIATIVVGEDAAATSNYVYAVSGNASLETYTSDDDLHTWTRTVISNGKEVELTYQGDSLDWISRTKMVQGNWYKVSYNSKGNVTKAELVTVDNKKIVDAVDEVEPNADDVVLLTLTLNNTNDKLTMKGMTLYTDDALTNGFAVADDAVAVLIENVDDDAYGKVTYYDSGKDNVADAIDDLYKNFNGELYAIFDGGVATAVILKDSTAQYTETGSTTRPTGKVAEVVLGTDGGVVLKDKEGTAIITGSFAYTLYQRGASQETFGVAETGTLDATGAMRVVLGSVSGSAFYVVVDGVTSNTVRIA